MKLPSYRFLLFASMMLFVFIADAIMSYYAPVLIEETLKSSTKMGFILATSSVAGMLTDFVFAQMFNQKKAFFFQRILFLLVFLFPLSFIFPPSTFTFIMAMIGWGVSYEAMIFCTYHAIHEAVGKVHHAWAWGLVAILKNVALFVGPLIASTTFMQSRHLPIYYAVIFNAIAVFLFFIYVLIQKKTSIKNDFFLYEQPPALHRTLKETIAIWRTLDRVLWPLLILLVLFYLFESAVFSVGPLFSEHLKEQHVWGGWFVSLYGMPGIFVGFFVHLLAQRFGKKKLSFLTGVLGGLTAVFMGFASPVGMVLAGMFVASFWLAIMQPVLVAVFEDLIARGEPVANDLISMTALTSSFSYIVGPILNGFLNDQFGELAVFTIWGALIFIWSMWLLLTFPRKVHLPQKELLAILTRESDDK